MTPPPQKLMLFGRRPPPPALFAATLILSLPVHISDGLDCFRFDQAGVGVGGPCQRQLVVDDRNGRGQIGVLVEEAAAGVDLRENGWVVQDGSESLLALRRPFVCAAVLVLEQALSVLCGPVVGVRLGTEREGRRPSRCPPGGVAQTAASAGPPCGEIRRRALGLGS